MTLQHELVYGRPVTLQQMISLVQEGYLVLMS
jgi:hypothetical protein